MRSRHSTGPSQFRVLLQPIGEWSGEYTGEGLGLDGNTVQIFLQDCGRFDERGPEFTDVNLHLTSVSQEINRRVPHDFNGLIILDARFYPISLGAPGAEKWARPRVVEVRQRETELSEKDALVEADRRWQSALERIYGATIQRIGDLRPSAQVAFRDMISPSGAGDRLKPEEPLTDFNTDAMWLWKRVDAICPTIEFDAASAGPNNARETDGRIKRRIDAAVRIADHVEKETGHRPQVLPILNSSIVAIQPSVGLRTGINTTAATVGDWISPKQTTAAFNAAVSRRADGIILSQIVADHHPRLHSENEFINDVLEGRVRFAMNQLRLGVFADAHADSDSPIDDQPDSTPDIRFEPRKPNGAASGLYPDSNRPPLTEEQLRRVCVRVVKRADSASDSRTTLRSSSSRAGPRRIILNGGKTRPARRSRRPSARSRRSKPKEITIERSKKSDFQDGVTVKKETTKEKSNDDGSK